jgi:phage gpG-like protein
VPYEQEYGFEDGVLNTDDLMLQFSQQEIDLLFKDFGLKLQSVTTDGDKVDLKGLSVALTKFIQEQIELNFKREGRPKKWHPISHAWYLKKIGPTILTNTGEMRRSLQRGKATLKFVGNNLEFVYKFPFSGNQYKYTVPLTGAKGGSWTRNPRAYMSKKKMASRGIARDIPMSDFRVPPRPWDYFDPKALTPFLNEIAQLVVQKVIVKQMEYFLLQKGRFKSF